MNKAAADVRCGNRVVRFFFIFSFLLVFASMEIIQKCIGSIDYIAFLWHRNKASALLIHITYNTKCRQRREKAITALIRNGNVSIPFARLGHTRLVQLQIRNRPTNMGIRCGDTCVVGNVQFSLIVH